MRIMQRDTSQYSVKRPTVQADASYFGSKNVWSPVGTVEGQLTNVNDSLSVELYGDKVTSMYKLTVLADADIQRNDRVVIGNGEYTVISLLSYTEHKVATLQLTEV